MKKLILILTMLFMSISFGQSNPLLLLFSSGFTGDLFALGKIGLNEVTGLALSLTPAAPFTLTQTGAQVQTILDGTFNNVTLQILDNGGTAELKVIGGAGNWAARLTITADGLNDADDIWTFFNTGNGVLNIKNGSVTRFIWNRTQLLVNSSMEDYNFVVASDTKEQALEVDGATGHMFYDSLANHREKSFVLDDAEILLATGVAGWGFVMIGDAQEKSTFYFTAAGVVTLGGDASANVTSTDTDAKLAIYDKGSGVAIKNRLGSALMMAIDVKYYAP